MIKKGQIKEKQLAISQKVKKMFRYSPSYQAQKCYSNLPLKYSNASNKNDDTLIQKNSEINCEYSSVKQKQFDTNQCNDTSSWIAKLVNGIQDQDQENKMFHRLSQIENKSINDLPEDSQDYDNYNQFLLEKADSLFMQKDKQLHVNFANQPLFQKQTPVTKPMKKSIKQSLIEIQLKQNTDGLRGPHVTRDNSCTKRENLTRIIPQKQTQTQIYKTKITPRKSQTRKSLTTTKSRTSLLTQKPKSQAKIKNKTTVKNNNRTINEIITRDPSPKMKKQLNKKTQKADSTIEYISHKNSMISTGTKKQSIHRVRYETQEFPTRKNSFIDGTDFQDKQDFKIVDQHSKNLNMKSLFEEQKHVETKPCSSQNLNDQIPVSSQKRIGSIKKNKTKVQNKQNVKDYYSQNDSINIKSETKINPLNQQLSSIQLESNRNINNFTLNKKNFQENILVELSTNRIRSNRCNILQNIDNSKILQQNQHNLHSNRKKYINQSKKETQRQINIQKRVKLEQIQPIFDKIRLDRSNPILSRNNLKLRGLTEEQKTQLGSIITKIHYQNATYDLQTFSKEFTKMNYECSLKGCLSQQKLKRHSVNQLQKKQTVRNQVNGEVKNYNNENKPNQQEESYFQQNEQICEMSSTFIPGIRHTRRSSNIVKKKLFDEINKISYLEEVGINHLEKNSRVTNKSQTNHKIIRQRVNNENQSYQNEQNITKDPYIEGPSLVDIQITKRDMPSSNRTAASSQNGIQNNRINLEFLANLSNTDDQNGTCLIERLNRKLSNYIDKNQILTTYRQFNLNFSELKKHIR